MSTLSIPNIIAPNTPRDATPLQENFTAIATWASGGIGADNLGVGVVGSDNLAAGSVGVNAVQDHIVDLSKMSTGLVLTKGGVTSVELQSDATLNWTTKDVYKDVTGMSLDLFRPNHNCVCFIVGRVGYRTKTNAATGHYVTAAIKDASSGTTYLTARAYMSADEHDVSLPICGAIPMNANQDYTLKLQVSNSQVCTGQVNASDQTAFAAFVLPR